MFYTFQESRKSDPARFGSGSETIDECSRCLVLVDLCKALSQEVYADCYLQQHLMAIQGFPTTTNLPSITSKVYCQMLKDEIQRLLKHISPKFISNGLCALVLAYDDFGKSLRECDCISNLTDSMDIFGTHVETWLESASDELISQCRYVSAC